MLNSSPLKNKGVTIESVGAGTLQRVFSLNAIEPALSLRV